MYDFTIPKFSYRTFGTMLRKRFICLLKKVIKQIYLFIFLFLLFLFVFIIHIKFSYFIKLNLAKNKMAGVRDIVQLKLQKRLIEEQLAQADGKMHRLGDILNKKTIERPFIKMYDENTLTNLGKTVADFRLPVRTSKAKAKIHVHDPYMTDPKAITDDNILRIRQHHAILLNGKTEVRRKIQEKEEKQKAAEEKRLRKLRKPPQIKIPESLLPNRYVRGELPCTIEHGPNGKYLSWACPLENLDYEYYLPLFFDGLQCNDIIVGFIARQGIEDMLYASRGHPERIKSVIPLLIRPLRNALGKFDFNITLAVLKAIEQLITCNEGIGEVLLPFGRQFMVPISYFLEQTKNTGDSIDYGQRKNDDIGEEVRRYSNFSDLLLLNLSFSFFFFVGQKSIGIIRRTRRSQSFAIY